MFAFDEPELGAYTVYIQGGAVRGEAGRVDDPDLEIQIGVETWRKLNRGEISAPEAALRRLGEPGQALHGTVREAR